MLESGQADELTGKAAVGDDSGLRFIWEITEILELAWRTLKHREKTFVQGFRFSGVDQVDNLVLSGRLAAPYEPGQEMRRLLSGVRATSCLRHAHRSEPVT
ncbi:hypothetical protein CRENBAI_008788 [Crenichthys baileyi]|uniref:Uncharacterized protein n=1 Tax=Crenichthys baileyi TaxID=28760 RepID=A0AAV9RKA7_9TELE